MSRKCCPFAPAAPCRVAAARSAAQLLPSAAHTLGSTAHGLCLLVLPAPSPSREGQQQRQPPGGTPSVAQQPEPRRSHPCSTTAAPSAARTADEGAEEAQQAVRDHNEIRDSVRAVQQHAAGSEDWWQALRTARQVNEEHLHEEERDALPLFRESTDQARREQLGRGWVAFHEQHQHAQGLSGEDVDPDDVVP